MIEFSYSNGKIVGFRIANQDPALSFQNLPLLWSASVALLDALKCGIPGVKWTEKVKVLHSELDVLFRAVPPNDSLGRMVLSTIPQEVIKKGVFPEDALKERFTQLESIIRKVDLVPADGASLLVHLMSYIQSALLFKISVSQIPKMELNDQQTTDYKTLNTDDILIRARFWLMERGDFEQALKYMNLLKGAPRAVAGQWMLEAKVLLETQLVARLLMAHATWNSLKYI